MFGRVPLEVERPIVLHDCDLNHVDQGASVVLLCYHVFGLRHSTIVSLKPLLPDRFPPERAPQDPNGAEGANQTN